jgi:hypothetical protein
MPRSNDWLAVVFCSDIDGAYGRNCGSRRLPLMRLNWIDSVALAASEHVSLAWPVAIANIGVKPMTNPVKPAAFLPLAKLPRIPASDLKKLGGAG